MHAAASASASRRVGRIHLLQSPHLLPRRIVIPSCCSCHVPLISTCLVPARSVSTATLSSTRTTTTTTTTTTPFTSNINIDNNNNYNNNNNNSNHVHRRDDGLSIGSSSSSSSVNPEEIAKFNELSKHWWDPDGEIGPLMHMNPIRMSFIRQHVVQHFQRYTSLQKPFDELNMLDVGCGGGLLSESLARLGAHVTGIDASSGGIAAAKQHAQLDPQLTQRINYECTSAESLLASGRQFDVVCALEIVEHVNDPRTFIQTVANLVKPGGMLFVSTINKNAKSYALAILGAEYIFGWVARGTHNWNQFITPDTLHQYITEATAIPSNNATHPNHTNHTTHHHNNNHHHHNHHHHHHHHATMNGNGGHHHGHVVGTTFPSVSAGLGIGASPSIAPTQPHTPVIHPEAVVTSARPPSLFFTIVSTKGLIYSPLHREFQLHDIDIDVNYIVAAKRPH